MSEKDEALIGNEKIEEYISLLAKEPSDEVLAVLLSLIRKRMKEKGQLVVSVEPIADGSLQLKAREIKGKGKWFVAFTSFDQQIMGSDKVMSTFKAEIGQLFQVVLASEEIQGVVINPWDKPLLLDRNLITLIRG